ncbi:MAG TPA: hypothetical protein VIS72_07750, partial [Anaerolineales bacterium]
MWRGFQYKSGKRAAPSIKYTSGPSISRILSGESPLAGARLCDHLSGRRVAAPLDATYPGLA